MKTKKNSVLITMLLLLGFVAVVMGAYILGGRGAKSTMITETNDERVVVVEEKSEHTDPGGLVCWFRDVELSPTDENIENWETFEGRGYSFQYPEDTVSIESTDAGLQISLFDDLHTVQVEVYELGVDNFFVDNQHVGSVAYEPFSNSWWVDTSFGEQGVEGFERCYPDPRGLTNDGKHAIYAASGSQETGAFSQPRYFVVMRDVGGDWNKTPLIVTFRYTSDHLYSAQNLREVEFKNVIENIVKSLELIPTSRG